MPARSGYKVCFKHGAGTRTRADAGAKKRPGRPRIHGLYSDAGRASVREEVRRLEQANIDLDDTDREMLVAKAVNVHLLSIIDEVQEARANWTANGPVCARCGGEGERAYQKRLDALTHRLAHNSLRIVRMTLLRAQIKDLLSRDHALATVRTYAQAVTHIVWDLLDDDALDVFERRMRDEVFRPLGVEVDLPYAQADAHGGGHARSAPER